tara:strand:+ start:3247 stop:3414 length:168 start_codon:yes stop_codon:yes gene_type:complete
MVNLCRPWVAFVSIILSVNLEVWNGQKHSSDYMKKVINTDLLERAFTISLIFLYI